MSERERAIGLYTFLKAFAQLRTRPVRDIATYEREGEVIWAADIPREPGCETIAWRRQAAGDDDDDAPDAEDGAGAAADWLEIRRPRMTPAPEPPDTVGEWVQREQVEDSSLELPELRSTIPDESEDDPPLRIEDHPDVQAAWDDWVEAQWWQWAEQDRRDRAVRRVYTDLFAMRQRQEGLGETYEVVFGLGFLTWQPRNGPPVRRHVVTARADIDFDAESGTLTVNAAAEGAEPVLEQDMLDPADHPDPGELRSIKETLEQIGASLWDVGPLDGLLKGWVHAWSPDGAYSDSLERPGQAGPAPLVHFAPALILRPRTERSLVHAFQEIIGQLEGDATVSEGVARFINPPADDTPAADAGVDVDGGAPAALDGELYFPLPANDAQRQIVRRLNANRGVLVQGPPGTGKSHTIVNLILHALATGQRVLVTSHAPRALRVLHEMIRDRAPEIAPLAVVLPGDGRDALREMEASVQGILDRQTSWSPPESDAAIERLGKDLDLARRNEAQALANLRAIREQETYTHDDRYGYSGTLARIAETLNSERAQLDWVPDDIQGRSEPPLTVDELGELVALLRNERVSEWRRAAGRASTSMACPPLRRSRRPCDSSARPVPPTTMRRRSGSARSTGRSRRSPSPTAVNCWVGWTNSTACSNASSVTRWRGRALPRRTSSPASRACGGSCATTRCSRRKR